MKYLHFPALINKVPIRLNAEETLSPSGVVEEFFASYDLNGLRMHLENWLEYAFSSDDPDLAEPIARVNLVQFKYHLEALIEANYLLFKK